MELGEDPSMYIPDIVETAYNGGRHKQLLLPLLGVMMHRCLHGQAPRYLADHLTPASEAASRLCLRSANRHQLIVPRC